VHKNALYHFFVQASPFQMLLDLILLRE